MVDEKTNPGDYLDIFIDCSKCHAAFFKFSGSHSRKIENFAFSGIKTIESGPSYKVIPTPIKTIDNFLKKKGWCILLNVGYICKKCSEDIEKKIPGKNRMGF